MEMKIVVYLRKVDRFSRSTKSRLEAEVLLSVVSLISSSTGFIWPR